MNQTLKIALISLVVAIVVTIGAGLFSGSSSEIKAGAVTTSTIIPEQAGAILANGMVAPPPSPVPYLVGQTYLLALALFGLGNGTTVPTHIEAQRSSITAATSTICAVQNPLNATTTLYDSALNITTGTSSAASIVAAISATPYATTTVIAQGINVAANAQASLVVGETASTTGAGNIVGPNQYVVWGTSPASAVAYGYTYGGTCQATFQSIN